MSKRSSKDAGTALLVIVFLMVVGIVSAIARVWSFLADKGLIWPTIILTVAAVAVFVWWTNRRAKQREQNRVAAIEANREAWGDAICHYLIPTGQAADGGRVQGILSHLDGWSEEACLLLLKRNIGLGMTAEMVRASLGEPDTVDNRDISARGEKYRWIYGVPRHGAAYIWFKDDKVVRVRQ